MNVASYLGGALAFKYPSQEKLHRCVYKLFILYSEFSEPQKYKCFPFFHRNMQKFIIFYFIYCSLEMTDQEKDHH